MFDVFSNASEIRWKSLLTVFFLNGIIIGANTRIVGRSRTWVIVLAAVECSISIDHTPRGARTKPPASGHCIIGI